MAPPRSKLPYYTDINEFLASIPWPDRTTDPDFYCLRLKPLEQAVQVYRPPFKRSFYFFALFLNSGKIEVNYGERTVQDPDAYLVFHSPDLVYSFAHNNALKGYVIYFKPECFTFFKPDFNGEFPLFDILHTNLFKFGKEAFERLAPHFEDVFLAYERPDSAQHMEARVKLLGLLYHLHSSPLLAPAAKPVSSQHTLLRSYLRLIDHHYLDKRTVGEYAALLSVSANYLSQAVKQASGKNALSFIAARVATEARSLVLHTHLHIAEIAYQLNFSDSANFSKFFKKQTGKTPSQLRKP
ncbi:helix-turn-helix domain-containing protein [Mucilaginibacter sp. HD30]